MSFDGADFVRLARTWYDEAKTASDNSSPLPLEEAILRTVIGNAYYGLFLVVRNRMTTVDKIVLPDDGTVHGFIRRELKKSSATLERMDLSNTLGKLHEVRKKADYNKPFGNILRVAETAVTDAEQGLDLVAVIWR